MTPEGLLGVLIITAFVLDVAVLIKESISGMKDSSQSATLRFP